MAAKLLKFSEDARRSLEVPRLILLTVLVVGCASGVRSLRAARTQTP